MRRFLFAASAVTALLLSSAGGAQAATTSRTFGYLVGAGFLCNLGPDACPDVAMADNGDRIAVTGSGSIDPSSGAATGSGSFVHMNSAGVTLVKGTWTADRVLAFPFYGCGGPGLPAFACGGRAPLVVHLVGHPAGNPLVTLRADALMEVTCLIGSPPSGAMEGIRLNVKDIINFNKSVSGDTVFIATS